MIAALFLYLARCRSTQLKEALSLPPTNHFQNGGSLVSSTVCQRSYQVSMSAYSSKHWGKCFSLKRSLTAGSLRLAWAMNVCDGLKYSSSCQWTAIWASVVSATSVLSLGSAMRHSPFDHGSPRR